MHMYCSSDGLGFRWEKRVAHLLSFFTKPSTDHWHMQVLKVCTRAVQPHLLFAGLTGIGYVYLMNGPE